MTTSPALQSAAASKHTPGPWEPSSGPYIVNATGEGAMFSGGDWNVFPPPGEAGPVAIVNGDANARLISAAPDMLAALKAAKDFIGNGYQPPELVDQMFAAIAKAEGR